MHVVIHCVDKADHQAVRLENREAHLAYLGGFKDQIVAAGPTLNEAGDGMTGSVLVMEFADRAAAEAFCAGDPYAKAGLFQSTTILPWKKVLPKE
ncbi:MAG: YciI family protein [Magnetovibrionaceae bacterium]